MGSWLCVAVSKALGSIAIEVAVGVESYFSCGGCIGQECVKALARIQSRHGDSGVQVEMSTNTLGNPFGRLRADHDLVVRHDTGHDAGFILGGLKCSSPFFLRADVHGDTNGEFAAGYGGKLADPVTHVKGSMNCVVAFLKARKQTSDLQ